MHISGNYDLPRVLVISICNADLFSAMDDIRIGQLLHIWLIYFSHFFSNNPIFSRCVTEKKSRKRP